MYLVQTPDGERKRQHDVFLIHVFLELTNGFRERGSGKPSSLMHLVPVVEMGGITGHICGVLALVERYLPACHLPETRLAMFESG